MSSELTATDPQVLLNRSSLHGWRDAGAGCQLSPRRRELLQLLADGCTVCEAAKEMGITYNTAKATVRETKNILGADTLEHAVAMGIRRKIIT